MNAYSNVPASILPQINKLRSAIRDLVAARKIITVCVFGSALRVGAKPRDIDIALVTCDSHCRDVASALLAKFPEAVVEIGDYTRTHNPQPDDMNWHFVVASPDSLKRLNWLFWTVQQEVSLT